MAKIIPFRGYRYDPAQVGDPSDVVSPPYDRVDPKVQRACYDRSPFNIVRIIKGVERPGDGDGEDVYSRAATYLKTWIDDGILVRDADPTLYAYHQTYTFAGERLTRKGVVALGKLEPEKVHAHEQTLRGPREDRLRLMRATEANFGQIFMLYADPARAADAAIDNAIEGVAPSTEVRDADGNVHRLWAISEANVIRAVQAALADRDLYIADGHHRYETAVNYMRECEEKGWRPAAAESFDVRMMTLFNVDEPGMSIRPIHRLIHGIDGFDPVRFLERASEDFVVDRHETFEGMVEATERGREGHTFGCVTDDGFASLQLKDRSIVDRLVPGERSVDYRGLDVTILHVVLLDHILGIDVKALEEQRNVTYTVDARSGAAAVEAGEEQLLFFLNATSPEEVIRVADHGEKMPQKSTDFYPKLLTGLVLSKMEIDR